MVELNPGELKITQAQKDRLVELAEKWEPNEACGLIGGENGIAKVVYPITNISEDPFKYRLDPQEQVAAYHEIEELGLQLTAFFHSHPHTIPAPSPTDIAENMYPNIPHLIIGKKRGKWTFQGYLIKDRGYIEIEIVTHSE